MGNARLTSAQTAVVLSCAERRCVWGWCTHPNPQGVTSFNVAIWGIRLRGSADLAPEAAGKQRQGGAAQAPPAALSDAFGGRVFCRVVSRGNAASKASDFGTLEVLGGASIGHTDPWVVSAAIREELGGLEGLPSPAGAGAGKGAGGGRAAC